MSGERHSDGEGRNVDHALRRGREIFGQGIYAPGRDALSRRKAVALCNSPTARVLHEVVMGPAAVKRSS